MDKVAKIKFEGDLKDAINKAVDELGGFKNFISAGDRVLLKPNFNTADPPPASTDLGFLKTVAALIMEAGAGEIIIGDSSTVYLKTRKVMEEIGVFDLEKTVPNVRVAVFEEGEWVRKKIPGGKFQPCVAVPKILDEVDKLILLPCLKTHKMAQFTGALKLAVGFMKPIQRLKLHVSNLQEKVAEINGVIKPDLIIMDGRKCFINRGPAEGDLREPNLILASKNRVAIDIEGIKIIQGYEGNSLVGFYPQQLPQIKRAVEIGVDIN